MSFCCYRWEEQQAQAVQSCLLGGYSPSNHCHAVKVRQGTPAAHIYSAKGFWQGRISLSPLAPFFIFLHFNWWIPMPKWVPSNQEASSVFPMQHAVHKAAVQHSKATHIKHGHMKVCPFFWPYWAGCVFDVCEQKERGGKLNFFPDVLLMLLWNVSHEWWVPSQWWSCKLGCKNKVENRQGQCLVGVWAGSSQYCRPLLFIRGWLVQVRELLFGNCLYYGGIK